MRAGTAAIAAAIAMVLVAAAAVAFGAVQGTLDVFTAMLTLWVLVGALIVALRPATPSAGSSAWQASSG